VLRLAQGGQTFSALASSVSSHGGSGHVRPVSRSLDASDDDFPMLQRQVEQSQARGAEKRQLAISTDDDVA